MAQYTLSILVDGKDNASGPLGQAGGALASLGKAAVAAGAAMAGAFAAGLVVSTKSALDFETKMLEVFTLLPDSSQAMQTAMSEDLQQLSMDFGVLTEDAVPALYQAISAGVPADNVFDFLEIASKAARGGVTDLEIAVDGITSVVNAYGAEVIDATTASDLMFTAVRLGKTDFEQLSKNLFNVIPTAASLGIGFDEVTAALASMTAQGTPTSVATTQLRQLFVELAKEGGQVAKTFEGIAGQSFPEFISAGGDVNQALILLEGYALENDITMGNLFSSVEAGNAALALTGKGAEMFARNLDEMEGAAGATDEAFNKMSEGAQFSLDKIAASWDVIKITIGTPILDAISPIFAGIADTVSSPEIQNGIAAIGESVAGFISGTLEYLNTISNMALESERFNQVMDILRQTFDTIAAAVLPWLLEQFTKISTWLTENEVLINQFKDVLIMAFQFIAETVGAVITDVLLPLLSGLIDVILGMAETVMLLATGDWAGAWASMQETFTIFGEAIKNAILGLLDIIAGWFGSSLEEIGNVWSNNWNMFVQILATVAGIMITNIIQWWGEIQNYFLTGLASLVETWQSNWDALVFILSTIASTLLTNAQNMIADIASAISGGASALYNAGVDMLGGLMSGIESMAGEIISFAAGLAADIADAFADVLDIRSPSLVFAGFGKNIMQGLEQGMESMAGAPVRVMENEAGALQSSFSGSGSTSAYTYGGPITINISGAGNPDETAGAVIRQLRAQGIGL